MKMTGLIIFISFILVACEKETIVEAPPQVAAGETTSGDPSGGEAGQEDTGGGSSSSAPGGSTTSCGNTADLCIFGTMAIDLEENGDEQPLEGVLVEIEDDPAVTATTEANGVFTLTIAAPTDDDLGLISGEEIRKRWERYKSRRFNVLGRYEKNGKRYAKRVPSLTFVGGNQIDLGSLKLEETGAIQGTVSLADGESPLGIDVYIPGTSFTAKASDTGSFIIVYIPAGNYQLIYEKDGYYYEAKGDILVRSKLVKNVENVSLQPIIVDTEPPVTPSPNLVPGELTNDPSPTLSWSESSVDTAYYELQVDLLSSFNSTNLRNFSGVKLLEQEVIPQLTDDLWYYRVRAVDYSGNASPWSTALTVSIDTEPSGVPVTNLFPTPTNDDTPTFTWEAVTGASGYRIQVAEDDQFSNIVIDDSDLTSVSFTAGEALSQRLFFWRLASLDEAGNQSAYSLPKQFEIDTSLPDAPVLNAMTTPTNVNTPTFSWNAITGASKYRVQIDNNALFGSPLVDDAGVTTLSFNSPALSDGTWYFRVASIDGADNQSGFSNYFKVIVDTTPPSPPILTPVSPDPTNDKTPLLRWVDGAGVPVSWDIQVDDGPSFSGLLSSQTGLTETELQIQSLLPTGIIHWRVRQIDDAGNESAWATGSFEIVEASTTSHKFDFSLINNEGMYHYWTSSDIAIRNGYPVYAFSTDIDGDRRLRIYGYKNLSWELEYTGGTPTDYFSPSFSKSGKSIVNAGYYAYDHSVRLVKWDGTSWTTSNSVAQVDSYEASIFESLNGDVHIAYYTKEYDLRYQYYDGVSWSEEVVDFIDNTGASAQVTEVAGLPEIVYVDRTEEKIRYAKFDGTSWSIYDTGIIYTYYEDLRSFFYDSGDRYIHYYDKLYRSVDETTWVLDKTIFEGQNGSRNGNDNDSSNYTENADSLVSCAHENDGHGDTKISLLQGSSVIDFSVHLQNSSSCNGITLNQYSNPVIAMYYVSYEEHYAVSSYPITTIDASTPNLGKYSSITFFDSNPVISYMDAGGQSLKFASSNGETWSVDTVDNSSQVGEYTSVGHYSDGDPGISYYDANLGNLKYAFNDGGAGWTIEVVDNNTNVGQYTSLQINISDHPKIAYYDVGSGDLKHASFNGSSWTLETVDSAGDVGQHIDLELTSGTERGAVAYYDVTNGDLKYASYNGSSWDIETVDSTGDVGRYASLELRPDNDPVILYYDETNKKLKIAEKDSGSWTIETVDYVPKSPSPASAHYGEYCDLVIESDGDLHISFYDATNTNLIYGYSDGAQWGFKIADGANVEDGNVVGESEFDFTGNVGKWTSIGLRQDNGAPGISYFDESEGILKYVEGVVTY